MFALLQSEIANQQSAILIPVYASLAAYLAALALLQLGRRRAARVYWTAGALLLLVHVAAAFHWSHHWSHAAAYEHTAEQTEAQVGWKWGGGLWLNYLITAGWMADVGWWWITGDDRYRNRPRWMASLWHAFLAFMWFNGAVVFAATPRRLLALVALTTSLAILLIVKNRYAGCRR